MPEGDPLAIEKQPMGGPVNQPASGTYGEKAALNNLQAQLPQMPPAVQPGPGQQGPPVSPQPPITPTQPGSEGRPQTGGALPPGVPSVIVQPTNQPNVPVSTPLQGPPAPGPMAQTSAQRRLQILDTLANSPDVAKDTQEWAKMVMRVISGG